jgi:hypothetical protein
VEKRYRLEAWIVSACLIFVGVLALSAFLERDVLRLHILQSFIYVAVIWLTLRGSKWGDGIGISIAFLWDFYNVFTGFVFRAGFHQWSLLLHGKAPTNLVQFSAPIAFFDHLVLIGLLAYSYAGRADRRWSDALGGLAALAGTFLYFAGIIALSWPQFLPRLRAHFGW